MKLRHVLVAASILFAAVGLNFTQAAPASATSSGDFVSRINSLRASHGLGALQVDSRLSSVAQGWAQQMANANAISHNPALSSISGNWKKVGENVGVGGDVDSIFNALVASPHHYDNMVDSSYTSVGVGIAIGSDGRLYTTHDFANYPGTSSAPAAKSSAPATTAKPKAAAPKTTTTAAKPKSTTTNAPAAPSTSTTEAPAPPVEAPAPPPPAPVLPAPSTRIVQSLTEVGSINTQG